MDTDGNAQQVTRLRQAVARHRPNDQRETDSCRMMVRELDRLPMPFDEHADSTHVTASGIVVGPRGVILHKHRRLGRWLQPGGHLEAGEDPTEAVLRECLEETGLTVVHPTGGPLLIHVDVHPSAHDHLHLDPRYLVIAPDSEPAPPPEESQEVAWFSWEDATELADEALSGALRAAHKVMQTSIADGEWEGPP